MKKGSVLRNWTGLGIAIIAVTICLAGIGGSAIEQLQKDPAKGRADIISIDAIKVFGKLERQPVTFLHQKHTEALDKKGKDCQTCHLSEDKRMSLLYMRLKNTSRQDVMEIYHTNCIACHRETSAAGEKSGPVTCGNCHRDKTRVLSSWQPIGMDKSLHYRHVKANQEKCERCHHEFNEETKKLFYAKGKEGTCRYCHPEKAKEKTISLRSASHLQCIDCHRQILAKDETAGPITCSGCHDQTEQKLIEKAKMVPRMKRNQPDFVLVKTFDKESGESNPAARMDMVPFNHMAHETYNDTCRVCHHADLGSCARCHTIQGSKDGNYVKLEQAMHRLNASQSCMGCHESKQSGQNCAGCHVSFENKQRQDPSACKNCHMVPRPEGGEAAQLADEKQIAATTLKYREAVTATYDDHLIPETVMIDALKDKYEPVKLPHRKIITAMVNNIRDNKLANYFHHEKGTVCQGCHHKSPASEKPPKCASCHGRPFNENDPFKPGLMAAYHRQCMECHRAMGIAKPVSTDCKACHRESG
jgi:hypothetical protein